MELTGTVFFLHAFLLLSAGEQQLKRFTKAHGYSLTTFYDISIRRSAVECVASCTSNNSTCKIASYANDTKACCHGNNTEAVGTASGSAVYEPDTSIESAEDTETGYCTSNWTFVGERCLLNVNETRSWSKSQNYCQSLGGNLAHIYNLQDLLTIQVLKPPNEYLWLGINDIHVEEQFESTVWQNVTEEVVEKIKGNRDTKDCCIYDVDGPEDCVKGLVNNYGTDGDSNSCPLCLTVTADSGKSQASISSCTSCTFKKLTNNSFPYTT